MSARHVHKADFNQDGIIRALRKIGVSVVPLTKMGGGVPDLLCGYRGINWLLEVKGETGGLTEAQVKFHARWNGHVTVVRTAEEAVDVCLHCGD
jgi:hypothetical protein